MANVARQPVHTVYGGAHLFRADAAKKLGMLALAQLDHYAADATALSKALGLDPDPTLDSAVYARLRRKLETQAIEDLRVDFEDGYGFRSDAEEDGHAESVAKDAIAALSSDALPPFFGIRVKAFTYESRPRAVKTLDIFGDTLMSSGLEATGGRWPSGFVVTLPKVRSADEVGAFAQALERLELRHGQPIGTIPIELMIETPEAIFDPDGRVALPGLIAAGGGRVRGCHFGTYDFTAACHVSAAHQTARHPLAEFALGVMQVALAPTSVTLSDGATTYLPIPTHRASLDGVLTPAAEAENRDIVHHAWRLHFANVTHALTRGIHQGWDLHPGQLVPRFAAVYRFFRASLPDVTRRLWAFAESTARATRAGAVFDDAATGLGLRNHFVRALDCGAIDAEDVAATGLSVDALRAPDFIKHLSHRPKS